MHIRVFGDADRPVFLLLSRVGSLMDGGWHRAPADAARVAWDVGNGGGMEVRQDAHPRFLGGMRIAR
jgi:hypothetical protein